MQGQRQRWRLRFKGLVQNETSEEDTEGEDNDTEETDTVNATPKKSVRFDDQNNVQLFHQDESVDSPAKRTRSRNKNVTANDIAQEHPHLGSEGSQDGEFRFV